MFSENLYLASATARTLYENYAKDLPIIDYHCHLSPKDIYENRRFTNIGELWLAQDHYKWRAMRAFGIDEALITGDANWQEKFYAFAKIMPELVGNPLYIWCALELKRYFNIDEPLCERSAQMIYDRTAALIYARGMSPSYFIRHSNVEYIATTDDPSDDLAYHKKIAEAETEAEDGAYSGCKIVPAFRPDKAMGIENPGFAKYMKTLGDSAGIRVKSFKDMLEALEIRLVAFKNAGGILNDNGLTGFKWVDYTKEQIKQIFKKALGAEAAGKQTSRPTATGKQASRPVATDKQAPRLTTAEISMYRSAFLYETAKLYAKHGFIAQYHIGAYRSANSVMLARLGPDTGFDGIDDSAPIRSFGTLLDRLNSDGSLPRTIFYPLDINQYEAFAALAANFCGNGRGWVQLGAPWWFNDQYYGITKQFESAGSIYPTALSMGMLTDSRSFLSYPRHELYRRALCGYLGAVADRGEYPADGEELGEIIRNICYNNAKNYLGLADS